MPTPSNYDKASHAPPGYEHCIRGHLAAVCGDSNGDCIECSIVETGAEAARQNEKLKKELDALKKKFLRLEQSPSIILVKKVYDALVLLADGECISKAVLGGQLCGKCGYCIAHPLEAELREESIRARWET